MSEPTLGAAENTPNTASRQPAERPYESRNDFSRRRVREVREAAGGIFDIGDSGGH